MNFLNAGIIMITNFLKRILVILLALFGLMPIVGAQIVVNSKFNPLSFEEILLHAKANAEYRARQEKQYEEYKKEAYRRFDNKDWYGFLTYSNYALSTGFYNAKLYYDRGCAYETLQDYKNAKKEYKKAKKNGFAYAENALRALKTRVKEYKRKK